MSKHSDRKKAYINKSKCINCGICKKVCSKKAIKFNERFYYVDLDKCVGCSKCAKKCPSSAIQMYYKEIKS